MFYLSTLNRLLLSVLSLTLSITAYAQHSHGSNSAPAHWSCGTEVNAAARNWLARQRPAFEAKEREFLRHHQAGSRNLLPIQHIPIKLHIVRRTNSTGGITQAQLDAAIDNLNTFYINANIQFYECGSRNFINDDAYYDFDSADENALTGVNDVPNLLNIYFFNSVVSGGNNLCGYAYFPPGPDHVMMANSCAINGSTLPHEVGHYFSLYHTHGATNGTLTTELVNGSNCATEGDEICDTPADPQLSFSNVNSSCQYTGSTRDANGDLFVPNPRNIMSYARKTCRDYFSPGQYARIYAASQVGRSHLTCPLFNVDFTASTTTTCNNTLTVQFSSNSVGATGWAWDVDGDGTTDYNVPNFTHTYNTAGAYDVRLTINNSSDTISETKLNYINIGARALPLAENFEQVPAGFTSEDWISSTSGDYHFRLNTGSTGSSGTGPSGDNTLPGGSGTYLYAEASQPATTGDVAYLESPCFQASSTAELTFAYHMFGANSSMGSLHVDAYINGAWSLDITPAIVGRQQNSTTAAFLTKTVSLNQYAGQRIRVRFRAIRGRGHQSDIALDDILIQQTGQPDPLVAFARSEGVIYESSASGNIDCRGYVDVQVPVEIQGVPTGSATATFNVSGTSTANLDYQLLTPSVTFANGSAATQYATVRIFNDEINEAQETLTLTYTLSGTTNAMPGTQHQSYTFTIWDNDPAFAQTNRTLLHADLEEGVLLDFLQVATQPTSAGWQVGDAASLSGGGFTIPTTNTTKLIAVNDVACGAGCDGSNDRLILQAFDLRKLTKATLQFDAYAPNQNGSTTEVLVGLHTPNGPWIHVQDINGNATAWQNNIQIDLEDYLGQEKVWVVFKHNDGGGVGSGLALDNIKLIGEIVNPPVATALGTTATTYLGPQSTVHMLSASGELLATLVNTSTWDFGCTNIEIDRAGTGAAPYTVADAAYYATDKTWQITSANPNPNIPYRIHLYYSKDEIEGWEAATGRTRNELYVARTGGQVAKITPTTPTANGNTNAFGTTPARTPYSLNDQMISGSFTNGFAGFTAAKIDTSYKAPVTTENRPLTETKIYPNPSTGRFTLDFQNTSADAHLRVVDVLGRTVWRADIPAATRSHTLDLGHLPAGNYVLQIERSGTRGFYKLRKQ